MTALAASALTSDARTALSLLNGVVCLYKPYGWDKLRFIREFRHKIYEELNHMQQSPRQEIVQIRRVDESDVESTTPLENENVLLSFEDGKKYVEVVKGLSYQDHPLVAGPRFSNKDLQMFPAARVDIQVSGVHLFGLKEAKRDAMKIFHGRWLKTYLVSGRFGVATNTAFRTGKVVEKSTYHSINRPMFERCLASTQSAHQRLSFLATGAPLDSDRAYELASKGLVRPADASSPVIYSIKCVDFNLPDFTLELKVINEVPNYLRRLIHELGLKLHSVAHCTKLQITNVGPFSLNDAIILKHWNVENVYNNIKNSREVMSKYDMQVRDMWVDKPLNIVAEPDDSSDDEK